MKQRILSLAVLCIAVFASSACSDDDKGSKPAGESYVVGDLYDVNGVKGVVFKLNDASGRRGLIVSLNETRAQWAVESVGSEKTGATETENGALNQAIVAAFAEWLTNYPAFAWSASMNTNEVTGWFLPAYDQLVDLYDAWNADQTVFNKFLTDNGGAPIEVTSEDESYWSSSENLTDPAEAASHRFSKDVPAFREKTASLRVRAVHSF